MPDFPLIPIDPTPGLEMLIWGDPWLAASALQKSLRRGDVGIVSRAVAALCELRGPAAVWRRLIIIAFEDIGTGQSETVADLTMQAVDAIRRKRPLAPTIMIRAARALADAAKDRSADYLLSIVALSPALEPLREHLGATAVTDRLDLVADDTLSLEERATAAWYCSGLNAGDENRLDRGDRPALMQLYRDLGVPEPLVTASAMAATLTREPICVFFPLIWVASRDSPRNIEHPIIRPSPRLGGMPLYAMGMHTRSGRQAIVAFAKATPVREVMERWVPAYRARDVAFNAEFHIEGGLTTPTLHWPEATRIKRLAIETDLVHAGADPRGIDEILTAFADNIDLLNEIRARVLADAFGGEAW